MSFTRSSALTFFKGRTRIETSCGFSVSRRSISRWISGSFAFGAATISRLEVLSGQRRTCWPGWPLLDTGGGPPPGGSGLLTTGDGSPAPGEGGALPEKEPLRAGCGDNLELDDGG